MTAAVVSLTFINGPIFLALCLTVFAAVLWGGDQQAQIAGEFDPNRAPDGSVCECFGCRLYGAGACGDEA